VVLKRGCRRGTISLVLFIGPSSPEFLQLGPEKEPLEIIGAVFYSLDVVYVARSAVHSH